jgi:lysozyme
MNIDVLKQELTIDEGKRNKPYVDTVGKMTIGIGRNLTDAGLSDDEIDLLLLNDINKAFAGLTSALPWVLTLSDVRQRALTNMCFNLGLKGLLGFATTLGLIKEGKYTEASESMLKSKWATQVGARAKRLSLMIKEG